MCLSGGIIVECIICGKTIEKVNKIEVEGSVVEVCDTCVKYGKLVEARPKIVKTKKITKQPLLEGTFFVEDYGKKIRKARENLGLKIEEFAKKIAEKESVVRKIENQQMEPDEKLVDKIEKFLKIKIKETPKERERIRRKRKKPKTLTIGDVARIG